MLTLSAATILANMLVRHEIITLSDLKNAKQILESEFEVYVDISITSISTALFWYGALFEKLDTGFVRAPGSGAYFEGTYVDDWFNSELPSRLVAKLKLL